MDFESIHSSSSDVSGPFDRMPPDLGVLPFFLSAVVMNGLWQVFFRWLSIGPADEPASATRARRLRARRADRERRAGIDLPGAVSARTNRTVA